MRKSLTAALAALTFGGAIAAAAAPAQARDWDYRGGYDHGGYRDHHRNNDGAAVVAGIAGLAIGAALASGGHSYAYDRPNYRPYYRSDYYAYDYAPAYRICEGSHWVWDPYLGRNVLVRDRFAC